jgi:sigma-54 dependent transcriptional regulator, acetoin dehydrogenase operon transcriptional activator AcoR
MINKNIALQSLSQPINQEISNEGMASYPLHARLSDVKAIEDLLLVDHAGNAALFVSKDKLVETMFQQWNRLCDAYDTLLKAVDDAITIVDQDGHVLAWNPKAEELYGTSREAIIGSPITDFFQKESVVLMNTITEGTTVTRQYNQPRQNVHVLINSLPIINNGEIMGGISVERDITDIVKLNDELSTTAAYIHDLESQIEPNEIDDPFYKIKGRSQALNTSISLAKKVARTDATVMITGESGVGKELFAQAIHKASARAKGPFVDLNCGAIPAALFESELFGYEKGAFTGAVKEGKLGKIGAAKNGTLFLDEIGELPLELQVKLLRVLQEKQYYRVGGTEPISINLRIIAATNRDLEKMVEEGLFREDLYYRLNVVVVPLPPLRERIEDLPELVQLFLKEFSLKYDKPVPVVAPEVMVNFMHYPWNGNIRQLKNTVERMMILADDNMITVAELPTTLFKSKMQPTANVLREEPYEDERSKIVQVLQQTYGNKSAAAKMLGWSRVTLYNKMRKYGL